MHVNKTATILWAISSLGVSAANADVNVVTSIKPVHSLVSSVMQGVGSPTVIIEGAGSPHTYSLKPSQAKQLQDADLVFWMGDELETFLEGPIQNIAKNAKSIKLIDSHGLKKIKFREGGMFDEHDDHDDHDDHGKENTPRMIMTTTGMTNTPRMITMTTGMINTPRMIMMTTGMVNLTHMYGWTRSTQKRLFMK